MSDNIVLFGLLESTFALLLEEEDVGQNCEQLVVKLDEYIQQLRKTGISNELLTSLSHLKNASVALRACFANLTHANQEMFPDNSESKLPESKLKRTIEPVKANDQCSRLEPGYPSEEAENPVGKTNQNDFSNHRSFQCTPKDAKLQEEVQEMKASDKFDQAMKYFQQSNTISTKVLKKREAENERETKIQATKVWIISEILGNLTDLYSALENCKIYISELHSRESFNTSSVLKNALYFVMNFLSTNEDMDSIIHINVVVFSLMKEFIRRPVAMLDWPSIDVEGSVSQKYHPILGEPFAAKFNHPCPFTNINMANKAKLHIDLQISTLNCCGEIFANCVIEEETEILPCIIRITPSYKQRYGFDDQLRRKILSISIDCTDCETPMKPDSQFDEASSQSSTVSCSQAGITCKGKMYVLAQCKRDKRVENYCCFLYLIDMKGNIVTRKELGFLERGATEVLQARVFCVKDKVIIILDVTRRIIYVCDQTGKHIIRTVDVKKYFSYEIDSISYSGEILCLEGRRKLGVYGINICSSGTEKPSIFKPQKIDMKYDVQALAYNHKSEEFTVLCYTTSISNDKQYHLATYTKDGELQKDIKLDNTDDKYEKAILICHPNGPIVLLDKDKLLHLKMA